MNDLYLRMIMATKAVTRIFARGGGQLNRDTFLGEKIYQLSRIKDFRNFVEIGTWNGQGSTKCFMDALLFRRDASCLYSLESSKVFHEIAKQYWRPVFSTARGKEGLRLIYGRIIEVSELLPSSEIPIDNIEESENYRQWREEDILNYTQSPNVIDMLPRQIDVLMLDGGEFSTYAEFQKLRKRSGVVLLDDTKLLKCKRIREELLHDEEWRIVYDLPEERAGNFIACRWDYYNYINKRI